MLRIKLISIFLFGFVSLSQAQDYQEDITEFTLDNGLHIVVIENHRAPIVDFMVVYDVGAIDEDPGKSGLAHFVEHLMFKGTERYGPGEYDRIIKSLGGSNNAYTSQEYTAYDIRVYQEHLDIVMELEADRMKNATFETEISLREREVVIEERLQRYDSNPNRLLTEQLNASLFQNHPYRIPVIGWLHEIENLSIDDVKDFYHRHYHPSNATVVVGGDVNPEDVIQLADKHFGNLTNPAETQSQLQLIEPPQRSERRVKIADPRVTTPYIFRKYLIPSDYSVIEENLAAIAIMTDLLGGRDLTSALSEQLQLTNIATYTGAGYSGDTLRPVVVNIYVMPSEDYTLAEAEAKLDKVLTDFANSEIDDEDLQRIKLDVKYSTIYDRDDIDSTAFKYGTGVAGGLTVEQIRSWNDKLTEVKKEEIVAAAQFLLNKDLSVTGWLLPEEK